MNVVLLDLFPQYSRSTISNLNISNTVIVSLKTRGMTLKRSCSAPDSMTVNNLLSELDLNVQGQTFETLIY